LSPFDSAIERFEKQHATGAFGRGQLVASVCGTVVAQAHVGAGVDGTTRFQVMSASKPLVALAIAILEGRGLLDVSAPVARYVPELRRPATADITVLDVLTHRSGLLLERLVRAPELWHDHDALRRTLAAAEPELRRGTLAYESHAFGWILAEVVQAVAGRSLPEFLAGELPASLRGLRWIGAESVVPVVWAGKQPYRLGGVDLAHDFERVNNEITSRTAFVPGAGLAANALELTLVYDIFLRGGIDATGRRIVPEEILQRYTARATSGWDRVTRAWISIGRGLSRGWLGPHCYGWWASGRCYGHPGGFGVVAFTDAAVGLSAALVTDTHRGMSEMVRRFAPLASALRAAARSVAKRERAGSARPARPAD
jgi:CubicO group peptidase (beta-lactamase class C family)